MNIFKIFNRKASTKKYELIPSDKPGLYRVKALRDFLGVKKGEIGGYVTGENNLWQDGNAWIFGNAIVYGDAWVGGNARVYGDATVSGKARIFDNAHVFGNAHVYDNAWVYDDVKVYGDAKVSGNAMVRGDAEISGDAKVSSMCDFIVFRDWWSSGRTITWTRSNDMWRIDRRFYGTRRQLIKMAYNESLKSVREYERIARYVEEIKTAIQDEELNLTL